MSEQRIQDIATLAGSELLSTLPGDEIGLLLERLVVVPLERGATLEPQHELEPALYFVLDGTLELDDGEEKRRLGPGATFGETALAGHPLAMRLTALAEARLARLPASSYAALAAAHPRIAHHLAHGALGVVAARLDSAESRGAASPSGASAEVRAFVSSPPSIRVGDRLPPEVASALVVAGREGERLLGLDASVPDGAVVTPVTTESWEGRDVFRRSAGLVLLEAARRLGVRLQLGPSITSGRLVYPEGAGDRATLAQSLDARLRELIQASLPITEELWPIEDALARLREQGDPDACLLLEDSLESVVTLLCCGETRAAAARPLLPHAGMLSDVRVLAHPLGLLLDFGSRIRQALPRRSDSTLALELRAPRYGAPMTRSEAEWLKRFGVGSVGTFNRACVQGRVAELIRLSEGFHEKRVAELADLVHETPGVRIVAVAGPSSSGKTTFIKRLLVQLRVNGIEPLELSLDDYYADRASRPPGETGEVDVEALEALDLTQLRADLADLSRGLAVRPPRYDFQHAKSRPRAGAELRLGDRGLLLVEGIHALNPALYGTAVPTGVLKVFIHPATSLAFDRLTSLEPAEVRLLRRVVRDRHQRGFSAVDTLARWSSVRRAERLHIFPFQSEADVVFDSSLIYEVSVLRVYAERYLLEVPRSAPEAPIARRLRQLLQPFVPIHPDHVPQTSLLREFIGGSGFSY